MNQEILFAQKLESIKKIAGLQGNVVSEKQVEEEFAELSLNSGQLELVYDYLKKHGVGIGDAAGSEEFLSQEDADYLEEYLESIRGMDEVSDGQKQAYFISAMAGEKMAREQLIMVFLPKVADIAKLYSGQGVYLEDLIGQGNMALSEGVTMLGSQENATEAEGLLVRMIMDAMEELVQENLGAKGADKKMEDKVNEIAEKAKDLAAEMRRPVTFQELSEETGISAEEIEDVYRMSGYAIEDIDGGKK